MVTSPFTRKFLIVLAFVVCVFYLAFRVLFTFNTSSTYAWTVSVLLFVAECWGIFNLFLFFLQVWEVNEPPVQPVLEGRTVDVFVPTYNEDPALLRATLEACVRMDYPHKTFVLDDGRRPEVQALAAELGVEYIARPDNRHFKAGNLNYAFERTDGEFVVVLDADHVPEPHFITRLIGYFSDDRLGYVQTPHAFYNFDSFQARLDHANRKYWEEGHLFYYVIQPGRNHWGCPIFAGSAAMFRRRAIQDVGLVATETITEDLHTGLRMNAKGWRSLAITERLIAGQAAPDITTFHAQRLRWGTGNLSILKYDNPLFMPGLTLPQRLCYLGSMLHWASGLFKLIIYLTPIAMLFSGIPPVKEFTRELLGITLIYLVVSLTTLKLVSNGFGSIINAELFSMVNFWNQIKSTFGAILGYGSRVFNVTAKGAQAVRERQQKSVWPYIRPQTYLIILSVLALFWGWGKLLFGQPMLDKFPILAQVPGVSWLLARMPVLGFGISDDYFKPVVPTVWVLIHFWLAYKVTQRAFWPADRRFTTRHLVHVPVEYETAGEPGAVRYGVTVDLNDTGMAFVAYERFHPGDQLRFTLRGAGEVIRCRGEVRTTTDLTGGQVADGFRYGVLFTNLTSPQVDAINRICLHYGVPRMYTEFDKKRGGLVGGFKRWQDRGMSQRRTEARNVYQLPIVVNHGATEDTAQFSSTEDLSRSAAAALLDHPLPPHAPVGFLMASPLGEVRGTGRVLRASPEQYGGREYYRTVIEFNEFEGQGRTTLNSLVNPREAAPLKEALKPDRKPILAKMGAATVAVFLLAVVLLVPLAMFFQFYHKDDRKLRAIAEHYAASQEPLSDGDRDELDRIYRQTMAADRPDSDRLVLLMQALGVDKANREARRQDRLKVSLKLANLNAQDPGLQQSVIYAYLDAHDPRTAEERYQALQARVDAGERMTTVDPVQLRLSGARVADQNGNLPLAVERYEGLYKTNPTLVTQLPGDQTLPLSREYAGVLLKAGAADPKYYDKAKELLREQPREDLQAREMLAAAYLLRGRAAATDLKQPAGARATAAKAEYDGAEEVARDLETYGKERNRPELVTAAEEMRLDVQMARRDWAEAETLGKKLVGLAGGNKARMNPELLRRLSQIELNTERYADALDGFATLLERGAAAGDQQREVVRGFLDAAAQPKVPLGDREKGLAARVYADWRGTIEGDAIYLGRLALVLQRSDKLTESKEALDLARRQQPDNPTLQVQLADILLNAGSVDQAAEVLTLANPIKGQNLLAGYRIRQGKYDDANTVLDQMVRNYPVGTRNPDGTTVTEKDVADAERLRGTALSLAALKAPPERSGTAFRLAREHYLALQARNPQDKRIPIEIGNLSLWSAERAANPTDKSEAYTAALKQFTDVIEKKAWETDAGSDYTRAKVEQGFLDAASGAPALNPAQTAVAKEIAGRRLAEIAPPPGADPTPYTRLAWVLSKADDKDARAQASELLKRALAATTKPEQRAEIAGVLAAVRDFKAAAEVLKGLKRTPAETLKLAELYAGARQFEDARTQLTEIIADRAAAPEDVAKAKKYLAKVLAWKGGPAEYRESLALLDELTRAEPEDLKLKELQAEVSLLSQDFDKAMAQYAALLKLAPTSAEAARGFAAAAAKTAAPLTDEQLGMIYRVADAVSAADAKDALLTARVGEVYAAKIDPVKGRQFALKAYQLDPKDRTVRKEVGYVLASPKVGLFKEADVLLATSELEGEDRKYYVFVASQAENFEAARRQARMYLSEQLPGSLEERVARRLLADVLTWKGDYEEALAIYERLLDAAKKDRDLRVNIAEVNRFWQNYPTALAKYAELLNEEFENTQLWIGFIDAASSAQPDGRLLPHKELLLKVYDRYAASINDARRLSRLAWVMIRLGEGARANELLNRAVAANPAQPAVRKELAGVLAAADRRPEAIAMLTSTDVMATLDIKDLLNLADLLTAESQLERAEAELARVVTDTSEKRYRVRYASVLLWNGKYAKAQELFTKLQRDFPADREIALRLAQAYLWAKDYTTALTRYTALLTMPDPEATEGPLADPEIWRGYVDAAAGAAGEALREYPRRSVGSMFTPAQRDAIFRAYNFLPAVQAAATAENKKDVDDLAKGGAGAPNFEDRKKALVAKGEAKLVGLAGSMGRLGLLLGMLGDRGRSDGAFGAALAIDRANRDVWLQYAQTLTALGDDTRAKAVFDWLIANPATKRPSPNGPDAR
ncbi:MAG TPA: glycosyltransferase [Gemmataceae bacterium]|nr:glycosyltransferase [Gemmataceae bacterium]